MRVQILINIQLVCWALATLNPHQDEPFSGLKGLTMDMEQFDHALFRNKEELSFGVLHSMQNLTTWAIIEEVAASLLMYRLELIEEEIKLIRSFLQDYEESTGEALRNLYKPRKTMKEKGKVVGSSYLLGHRMTSRFCDVTKRLRKLLNSPDYIWNREDVKTVLALDESTSGNKVPEILQVGEASASGNITLPFEWPDWPDLYMSLNSFRTLQEINGIPPGTSSKGLTLDTSSGGELTIFQCAEIGIYALFRGSFYSAVEWLEVAMERLITELSDDTDPTETISIHVVTSLLALAIQEHNRMSAAQLNSGRNLEEEDLDFYTEPLTIDHIMKNRKRMTNRQEAYYEFRGLGNDSWDLAQHIDICLGYRRQTPEMQINLKCFYEKSHPYLFINPIKVERLSENPPVLQFYEMMGNETIRRIREKTKSTLSLSGLVGVNYTDYESITKYRSSVGSGFDDKEFPNVYKLAEMVSGLKIIGSSETTQVVEYVYGRHYDFHTDTYEDEEGVAESVDNFGDRVATMLYYLEIPEMGGLTSFCQAGLGAYQERSSAILWLNQYRNGTVRQDVFHGACPVIHGHKVVANHWIRYNGNWRNYKCTLDSME